jgi:hypothetical protein
MRNNSIPPSETPVKFDTPKRILAVLKKSGFTDLESLGSTVHRMQLNGAYYGFMTLTKTHMGLYEKYGTTTQFVEQYRINQYQVTPRENVYIIIIEKSTGLHLIGNLARLHGYTGKNNGFEGIYYPRHQFMLLDFLVSDQTGALSCGIDEIYIHGTSVLDWNLEMKRTEADFLRWRTQSEKRRRKRR